MKINLSSLSTKGLASLGLRVLTVSKKSEYSSMVANNPLLDILDSVYLEYDAVYSKSTFSGLGTEVAKADDLCDEAFTGLKSILSGYAHISTLANQQDAIELYKLLEKHGVNMNSYSYAEQYAAMKKLIEDFKLEANQAHLTNLNLTPIVELLESRYQAFLTIYENQVKINAELRQQESASSMRGRLEKALRDYISMVDAMKAVVTWKPLSTEIDEVIKAAKSSISANNEEENTQEQTAG